MFAKNNATCTEVHDNSTALILVPLIGGAAAVPCVHAIVNIRKGRMVFGVLWVFFAALIAVFFFYIGDFVPRMPDAMVFVVNLVFGLWLAYITKGQLASEKITGRLVLAGVLVGITISLPVYFSTK